MISLPRQAPKPRQRRADRFPLGDQPSLWESILPQEVRRLPDELARVDALLGDPAFFAPFVPYFDPRIGRPSTRMETYMRLMFLKFRYRLGYETCVGRSRTRSRGGCFAGSGWMFRWSIRRR